ncbi:site-specific integrase [Limnochorda pilosa]|uniref:Integrase n=1 Tax=Limnochorda pilosa TaxID=1555112 RepID=A0A0K2SP48_LIMPI|nr:integrase [Limnochorda pilosa]
MLQTGLRPGEATGLAWEHVDLKNTKLDFRQALHETGGELYLGALKTDPALRTLSLSKSAVQALKRQRIRQMEERLRVGSQWSNQDDLVFTNLYGGFLRRTNSQRRDLRRVIKRARIAMPRS